MVKSTQKNTPKNPAADELLARLHSVIAETFSAMGSLDQFVRYLHPAWIDRIHEAIVPHKEPVSRCLSILRDTDWPDELDPVRHHFEHALELLEKTFNGMTQATIAEQSKATSLAFAAINNTARAAEVLYRLVHVLPAVSQFFLQPDQRHDDSLLRRLAEADATRKGVGLMRFMNQADVRGGFCVYVPEYYDSSVAWPLLIALHGEQSQAANFIWSWLRNARALGAVLLTVTSLQRTWSLEGRDIDSSHIHDCLKKVAERWRIRSDKVMLTGISDGGTFCYLSGLKEDSPVTHIAPFCANFHPLLVEKADKRRLRAVRVLITHGERDQMFPVDRAREARSSFLAAGANVRYNGVRDLAHAYPLTENPKVMRWFLDLKD